MSETPKKNKWLPWVIGACLAITIIGVIIWYRRSKKKDDSAGSGIVDRIIEKVQSDNSSGSPAPPNPSGTNRGLRNNNPGNIRISSQSWKGKISKSLNTDGSFEQFTEKYWGVRAMTRIIKNWIEKGSATTLNAVVSKYAPSHENDTKGYIEDLAIATGLSPEAVIPTDKATLKKLIVAMGTMESGPGAITDGDFDKAWSNLA